MANDKIYIYDGWTGEYIERQLTDAEQQSRDAEVAANEAAKAAELLAKENEAKAKAEILEKLGLTAEEAAVLLG